MKQKCNLCEYEWESRTLLPKQCPRCKRYDWDFEKEEEQEHETN